MNPTTSGPTPNATTPSVKEEMDFRLSLLRLMTVPHEGETGVSPAACQQVEELSAVLVPKRQPQLRKTR